MGKKRKPTGAYGRNQSLMTSRNAKMIYVDVTDGLFRSSIGGPVISLKYLEVSHKRLKLQQRLSQKSGLHKRYRTIADNAKAQKLSTSISLKTGLNLSKEIISKTLDGIYPPLGIVKNGKVVKQINNNEIIDI